MGPGEDGKSEKKKRKKPIWGVPPLKTNAHVKEEETEDSG